MDPRSWKNLAKGGSEILRIYRNKMKYFFPMLCVVAAGGAGYVFEPKITPNLISDIKVKERVTEIEIAENGEKKVVTPKETALPKVDPAPTPPPVVKNDPEPPPVVKNDPEPPAPEPEPPVVKNDPEPTPAPTPPAEVVPAPAPLTPPPADPPAAAGGVLNEEDIVKVMQESIKGGKVNEFKFEQVLAWKAGSEETVDGTKYQTGEAAYKAETIFGVKTMQAKALIKDGKVAKWVWKTSGMEIK